MGICRPHRLSGFAEIGQMAFGKPGMIVGAVFSQLLLVFTPTLYLILAGDNVSRLASVVHVSIGRAACTWILAVIIGIPYTLVRTMRDVSFMRYVQCSASCLFIHALFLFLSFGPVMSFQFLRMYGNRMSLARDDGCRRLGPTEQYKRFSSCAP